MQEKPIIKTFREGINIQFQRLQNGELSKKNIFYIARDFENSLVEHKFYEKIEGEVEGLESIKKKLETECKSHLRKLNDFIETHIG
jgi:hypothetical protein